VYLCHCQLANFDTWLFSVDPGTGYYPPMIFSRPEPEYTAMDWQAMTDWFASPLGQHLLGREKFLVESMLARRFGYHLLQLGCSELWLHDTSPMGHKFSFCAHAGIQTSHAAIARGEAIPLANESVDLVLMHHALDFSTHQHQLLREVSRVLIAGGDVLIVGFNPYSTWGLRNKLHLRRGSTPPWNASPLGSLRVTDWLKLLDFVVINIRYGSYALPVNSHKSIRYSGWMENLASRLNWPTGGVYAILARKQVLPLTPIRKQWVKLPVPAMGLPVADKSGTTIPNGRQDFLE
jgi:SAM-dependent methyltransferase